MCCMLYTKKVFLAFLLGTFLTLNQACYGPFLLTKKIYNWNGKVGDKFVNSAVMWALIIIPVYSATLFVDFVVLNTVQFWTGTNPLAMKEGEEETQIVQHDENSFRITARRNYLEIEILSGKKAGEKFSLHYLPETNAWIMERGKESQIIAEGESQKEVVFYHPDGHKVKLSL